MLEGSGPRDRDLRSAHRPSRELRLTHVWRKLLHDPAMGNLLDEIHQRLLILPGRERPESLSQQLRPQRIADQPVRFRQLTHRLHRQPGELGYFSIALQRQERKQRNVFFVVAGRGETFPRNRQHIAMLTEHSGARQKSRLEPRLFGIRFCCIGAGLRPAPMKFAKLRPPCSSPLKVAKPKPPEENAIFPYRKPMRRVP